MANVGKHFKNLFLSTFKYPFKKECVSQITIRYYNQKYYSFINPPVRCDIYWINGDTKGQHEIKCENLKQLFVEMNAVFEYLDETNKKN